MPACHAGGHEFEPRTHRKSKIPHPLKSVLLTKSDALFFIGISGHVRRKYRKEAWKQYVQKPDIQKSIHNEKKL